jgi:hypothetical protein
VIYSPPHARFAALPVPRAAPDMLSWAPIRTFADAANIMTLVILLDGKASCEAHFAPKSLCCGGLNFKEKK